MFINPDVIWLNTNPYLLRFNLPIIKYLSQYKKIGCWEYRQNLDEASSLDVAIALLNDYLQMLPKPVHLVGHSTCGLLGLLYTHKYPGQVKSLTLLGVGYNAAADWLSYYYSLRSNLLCSQTIILSRMAKYLFGYHNRYHQQGLIKLLDKALLVSLSPHSLYRSFNLTVGNVSQPLMIAGSQDDIICTSEHLQQWQLDLKSGDYWWQCPQGNHFFHYFQPQLVGQEILKFWQSLTVTSTDLTPEYLDSANKY